MENTPTPNPFLTFFRDEETRRALLVFFVATVLIVCRVYYLVGIKDADEHGEVLFLDEWQVSFTEESLTSSETVVLADGGEVDLEFDIDTSEFSQDFNIGLIQVTVSYSETNQVVGGDPCDSVQGKIVQSDFPAQWADENNSLSGASSSCEDISLLLLTYPNYNGQSYTKTAHNEVIALDEWGDEGYGIGSFYVNIKLEVQQSQVPTQNTDDDETVQVDVEVIAFKASAEKLS